MSRRQRAIDVWDAYEPRQLGYRLIRAPRRWMGILSARRCDSPSELHERIPGTSPIAPPGVVVSHDRVEVHGHTVSLRPDQTWDSPTLTALARFHLHYLDWLGCESLTNAQRAEILDAWLQRYQIGTSSAWNPYVVSTRLIAILKLSDRLIPGGVQNIGTIVAQHTAYLMRTVEWDIGGNHLLRNGAALFMAGGCLGGSSLGIQARVLGTRILDQCLELQILGDGGHRERSSWYHLLTLSDLLDCVESASEDEAQSAAAWSSACDRMVRWLGAVSGQGMRLPLFGDGTERASRVWPSLVDRARKMELAGPLERPARAFLNDTGWYRCDLEQLTLAANLRLSGDRQIRGHTHSDIGTFELWDENGPLIVDKGTFSYAAGADRNASRRTLSHNTLSLNGLDQVELWGAFRVGRWTESKFGEIPGGGDRHEVFVEHDGFAILGGSPRHRRRFLLDTRPNRVRIEDAIDLTRTLREQDAITATRTLRFANGVQVATSGHLLTATRGGTAIRVEADQDWTIDRDEWWPTWGERQPATVARLSNLISRPWEGHITIEW